ncbi:hypothetical protein L1887_61957 [Cichorium endivia]|nr:hypothetical protein L1887_61957 [Cichorium endivia]
MQFFTVEPCGCVAWWLWDQKVEIDTSRAVGGGTRVCVDARWMHESLSKQLSIVVRRSQSDAILCRVVWVILGGDLEERREGLRIPVDDGTDLLGDVLVDEQDGDVLALAGKMVECLFDIRDRCLHASPRADKIASTSVHCRLAGHRATVRTFPSTIIKFFSPFSSTLPIPASRRPVVESYLRHDAGSRDKQIKRQRLRSARDRCGHLPRQR